MFSAQALILALFFGGGFSGQTAYDYTAKGNFVAVVSNGTAVLGLGDIGAAAIAAIGFKPVFTKAKHIGHIHQSTVVLHTPTSRHQRIIRHIDTVQGIPVRRNGTVSDTKFVKCQNRLGDNVPILDRQGLGVNTPCIGRRRL